MKISRLFLAILIPVFIIGCNKDDSPSIDIPTAEVPETSEIENRAPSKPLSTFPENGSLLQSILPNLKWQASTDEENETIEYDILVGLNESNLAPVIENIENTEFQMESSLEKGTSYYWRIVARDTKGNTTASEIFTFTTEHISVNLVTLNASFSKRSFSSTTVFNNKIWVIGGKDESNNVLADIWSSSDGINWNLETDSASFGAKKSHSIVVFKNKMWMYSGSNGVTLNNEIWSSEDGINWGQESNDSLWNIVPFYGQSATTMFVFDNKIWRFAAYYGSNGDLTIERNVWNSSDGKNWTLVGENHGFDQKYGMEVIPFQGKLIGIEGNISGSSKFSKIWQSSNGIDWEVIAENLPFDFGYYAEAAIFEDKLFLTAASGYNDIWFTEDGVNWQQAIQERRIPAKYPNSTVNFKNKVYIVGGGTHTNAYNDVWTIE